MKNKNNNAVLAGEVVTEPTNYDCCEETFCSFNLSVKRASGTADILTVNISKILVGNIKVGDKIRLEGQVRTYNRIIDGKSKLIIVFFAQEVTEYEKDVNEVELCGYICKTPVFRITPRSRPCIIWGRTARLVSELNTGAQVRLSGRLQSREYEKKTDSGVEIRTAYEVSVSRIQDASKQE